MEICQCEAIVLAVSDYREADRLVTLFTLEHGKVRGIARGAKRSVRRFGGALEPFARLSVQMALTGSLSRLDSVDLITLHHRIREDLLKIGYAGYACEATDLLLPEGLPNPRQYRLLSAWLERLDSSPAEPSDRRFFEINLLNILGYRPHLEGCARCGADPGTEPSGGYAGAAGEILCGRCGRGGRPVSVATLQLLARCLQTGRFGAVPFPPKELEEAGRILEASVAAHVSRPLKSLAFLRETGG
jgi:DNA repair protein RecO (recombination protein O)